MQSGTWNVNPRSHHRRGKMDILRKPSCVASKISWSWVDILYPSLHSVPCRMRNDLFRSESQLNKTCIGNHLHHIRHQFSITHCIYVATGDAVFSPMFFHGKMHLFLSVILKDLILSPKPLCAQALLSQLWVAHHDCGLGELPGEKTCSDNLFRESIQDPV